MRDILYRAKHIHALPQNEHLDRTWVYGYLSDKNYINSPDLEGEFLIDPETVCQYTGLTDKNGKKIFEGDILKSSFGLTYVVEWEKNGRYLGFTADRKIVYIDREPKSEVIGNIFDNPDLLTTSSTDLG